MFFFVLCDGVTNSIKPTATSLSVSLSFSLFSSGSNAWCRLFCRLVTAGGSDGLASVLKHRAALSSDMLISVRPPVIGIVLS